MSSLIELAAQRLSQLQRAGVVVPEMIIKASAPVVSTKSDVAPKVVNNAAATSEQIVSSSRLVELDLDVMAATGIVTPNAPRSQTGDQYRVIKRPLISNARGKGVPILNHGNLIMVTSSLAGEGKSYTSVNLAMSIAAELDNTVMLVDADVARPSILKMLGLHNLPRATELLASEAMRLLLEDMAERYSDRIIIFDSPPLLLTTESRVLASQMGQIVMVVQAGKTLRSDVIHALSTIEACPVRMLLLNKSQNESISGYGYGYGYGYGPDKQPG